MSVVLGAYNFRVHLGPSTFVSIKDQVTLYVPEPDLSSLKRLNLVPFVTKHRQELCTLSGHLTGIATNHIILLQSIQILSRVTYRSLYL